MGTCRGRNYTVPVSERSNTRHRLLFKKPVGGKNEGEGLLDWRVEVKRELKLLVGSRMTLMLALE
jgi:hypothetical protein